MYRILSVKEKPFVYILLFVLISLTSCSNEEKIDVVQFNNEFMQTLKSINYVEEIEKYGSNYVFINGAEEVNLTAKPVANGMLYVKDLIIKNEVLFILLSNGESYEKSCAEGIRLRYRLSNVSSLRVDGYDIVIEVILINRNGKLRINHGEPGIGGLVCSSFVDFTKGKIGYYLPFSEEAEKTEEILVEMPETIPFIEGHTYSIVSSKENGYVATIKITDNDTQETYQFTPDIGCYESGITHGWGCSSYEKTGEIEIKSFKVYSNQPYQAKLLILGDSNADHGGIGDYKWKNYARQIKTEMQGNAFLVVQGGASTDNFLVWLNNYVLDICSPQYCLITTYNENTYYKWNRNIQEIIDILENHQIIPILATIHPGSGEMISDDKRTMNDWMRNSGYFVFDMARVISKNNDGVTTNEKLLHLPDLVHFNFEANDLLAKDFFETFPFMKEN